MGNPPLQVEGKHAVRQDPLSIVLTGNMHVSAGAAAAFELLKSQLGISEFSLERLLASKRV